MGVVVVLVVVVMVVDTAVVVAKMVVMMMAVVATWDDERVGDRPPGTRGGTGTRDGVWGLRDWGPDLR